MGIDDNSNFIDDGSADNGPDFQSLLDQVKSESGQKIESLQKDLDEQKTFVNRMRDIFAPTKTEEDPYESRAKKFSSMGDKYRRTAQVNPNIPLTTELGTEFAEFGAEATKMIRDLQKEIQELKSNQEHSSNPVAMSVQNTMMQIEDIARTALAQMYPSKEKEYLRSTHLSALSRKIIPELKDLVTNDPDTFARLRSDPRYMKNMVNHFIKDIIPDRALEVLERDRIQNTELTPEQCVAAWHEAQDKLQRAYNSGDVGLIKQWEEIAEMARLEALEATHNAKRGKSATNELYRNF